MLKSVEEVLETAKRIEESSYAFYTQAQNVVTLPYLKKELQYLAEQEIDHRKKIEAMMAEGPSKIAKELKIERIQDMKLGDYLMPSHFDPNSTIQDILIAAIKREDLTHQFYQNLLKGAKDEDLRKVLEYLSIEELKHKNKVQFLYDDIVYKEN
ncbi:ferritin family protein [Athalassotoga saccharophila]|uniref:ferritin family protein n=1 Tax=Athalassotoga saccharophila TaxID=1441386 RepID=UPI00137A2784|nr:ferritin family protein [Athalassotoga saccharophila]BBJ28695.1 rubrerythrin [Athalassotoga saccharophila]